MSDNQSGGVNISGSSTNLGGNIVGRDLTITQPAPTPIAYSLHQLPSPDADFVGRKKELDDLLKQANEKGAHISGLKGQGGVGKTALAVVFAHAIRDQYPEAQLFIDLRGAGDQPVPPRNALEKFLRAFYPSETKFPDDVDELCKLYRAQLHDKRAIVVLDNAKDSAQIKPLIPPPSCFLLITSRFHFALPGLHPINLEILSEKDSIELLEKICPRLDSPRPAGEGLGVREIDEIASLCGYLPLALRAAASLLEVNQDLDPAHYLAQLRDERTRLEKLGTEGVDISVEASLNLSYAPLDDETKRVFRSLSVFPADFDATAEEIICDDPDHKSLSQLVRRSLVNLESPSPAQQNLVNRESPSPARRSERSESPSPRGRGVRGEGENPTRYSLHDLARLFADARMSDDERFNAQLKFAAHFSDLLGEANQLYLKGGDSILQGLNLFDAERVNIEHGQKWSAENVESNTEAARLCNSFVVSQILTLRQHPREQIRWFDAALIAARLLQDRVNESLQLGKLGLAYAVLGEIRKAIDYFEKYLSIARELKDRYNEGIALGNFGLAYADLGETRKAIEYYEQALAIAREIGDRRGEGNALGNLGIAYKNLGETRKAIEYQEQSLVVKREIGDRRGEGNALGNLGNAYLNLGETRKAIEYQEQSLVVKREIGDRRGEGAALGNLGSAYYVLGETRKAIEYYEQQLKIVREIGDRFGEATASVNTSLALDKLGERNKAIEYAEVALKIYTAIESPNAERVRKKLEEWKSSSTDKEIRFA